MRSALLFILAILLAVAAWAHWPEKTLSANTIADRVVVTKSDRSLKLFRGGALLKQYRIALGSNPNGPKQRQGDGRTPEGTYRLDYLKNDSSFHRALHVSYPSAADRIFAAKAGVDPGGLVMVHGLKNGLGWLGRAHQLLDWTDGCVAVTNTQIDEIARVVPVGTKIELRP